MNLLVVIDVQPGFDRFDNFKHKNKIITRIKQKIDNNPWNVFVNWVDMGEPYKELGKPKLLLYKNRFSAANTLKPFLEIYKPDSVELCGIYRDICVEYTRIGLTMLGYNVTVDDNASFVAYDGWKPGNVPSELDAHDYI